MELKELVPLAGKTTMRIGGMAHFYGEIRTKEDVEESFKIAQEKALPLIVLGGGSNTIFTNDMIEAVVVRMKAEGVKIEGNTVTVEGGVILGSLINQLAENNLDLSPLTGIPGSIGGAIFGNAGQGPKGMWSDTFVVSVEAFVDGQWKIYTKEECEFAYRESVFKKMCHPEPVEGRHNIPPIIWKVILNVPSRDGAEVKAEVERLIQKRIETQPHLRTAGSCFKAIGGTPAWQKIDAVGLRGAKFGGVEIAQKHANFLLNDGTATYSDAVSAVDAVKKAIPESLEVEMRFVESDGSLRF